MSQPGEQSGGRSQPTLVVSAFSGAGLGLMVGLLMGLASSSWVVIAVAALGAGLAAVLALNDRHFTTAKGLRLGAFGVAVVIAGPSGVYVRSHRLLMPSAATLAERKAEYLALGMDEGEAVELVRQWVAISSRTGTDRAPARAGADVEGVVEGVVSSGEVTEGEGRAGTTSGVLAAGLEISNCRELDGYSASLSTAQLVGSLEAEGARWRSFAERVRRLLPSDDQKRVLLLARDAVCPSADGVPPTVPTVQQCRQLEFAVGDGGEALHDAFTDGGLEPLYGRVEREVSPREREDALSLMVGVVCGRMGAG